MVLGDRSPISTDKIFDLYSVVYKKLLGLIFTFTFFKSNKKLLYEENN